MRVTSYDQLMDLLDGLYVGSQDKSSAKSAQFWDELFRQPDHPLGFDLPDAGLVAWAAVGLLGEPGGRALDVGCGLGRNSRWLAAYGYEVTGVDLSPYAIDEATRRSAGQDIRYAVRDVLRERVGGTYDLVYDSGCLHHLAPHRRISYLEALRAVLAPGGLFGICTFAAGRMGTTASDAELLRRGRLEGGIAYTLDELQEMFSWLEPLDARPMPSQHEVAEPAFTHDFLQVALFRRAV